MPIQIIRNDLTKMKVDAIVHAVNRPFASVSRATDAVFSAAGPQLSQEYASLGAIKAGKAKLTKAYQLPCKYVIHTAAPAWYSGVLQEDPLTACYRESLTLASKHGCQSIAFPLISSVVFGYSDDRLLKTAINAIRRFLHDDDTDMLVYLVVSGEDHLSLSRQLSDSIEAYIGEHYADPYADDPAIDFADACYDAPTMGSGAFRAEAASFASPMAPKSCDAFDFDDKPLSLEELLSQIDESFSQMVLRKIREKGMKNADCYKKANLERRHFSKISNDIHYKPRKQTALAIAVALELSYEETQELLQKAGLALSRSDKSDIIVEYFIKQRKYDIFEINEVLFYYDQPLLGAAVL